MDLENLKDSLSRFTTCHKVLGKSFNFTELLHFLLKMEIVIISLIIVVIN